MLNRLPWVPVGWLWTEVLRTVSSWGSSESHWHCSGALCRVSSSLTPFSPGWEGTRWGPSIPNNLSPFPAGLSLPRFSAVPLQVRAACPGAPRAGLVVSEGRSRCSKDESRDPTRGQLQLAPSPCATILALAAPETARFRGAPLCSLVYRWQCPRKLLLFPGSLRRHRPSRESQEIGLFVTVWINPPKNDIYPGLG